MPHFRYYLNISPSLVLSELIVLPELLADKVATLISYSLFISEDDGLQVLIWMIVGIEFC